MKTVLLVIDLQLGMFNGERLVAVHAGEALLMRVQALIAQARTAGVPVIYLQHDGGPGHLLEGGTAGWQIHPTIAPAPGETIVEKRTPDPFHRTRLLAELEPIEAHRLVVVGAQSEISVDTTCRNAFSLGFEVVLVSDGHSTRDNAILSAEQIIQHTNKTLGDSFVRLISSDHMLFDASQPVTSSD